MIALPGLNAWRKFQIQRLASKMLTLADEYAAEGDLPRALSAADWYRTARPGDPAGLVRVALLYRKLARSVGQLQRAHTLLSQAKGADPDNREVRASLAELELQCNDFRGAQAQAQWLLKRDPEDRVGARTDAIVAFRLATDLASEASTLLPKFALAVQSNPDDIALASSLAELYRQSQPPKNELADETLDRLVSHLSNISEAHLARARYRAKYRQPGVGEDLARALELDANHAGALAMAAQWAVETSRWDDACGFYERLIQIESKNPAHYFELVKAYWASKRFDAALSVCRRATTALPGGHVRFGPLLVELLFQADKVDEAEKEIESLAASCERFQSMRQISADQVDKLKSSLELLRARLEQARGKTDLAVGRLQDLDTSTTDLDTRVRVHLQLATEYAEQLHWNLAATEFENAAKLSPQSASLYLRAGQAWDSAGQPERAAAVLIRAVAGDGAPPSAHAWLAQALLQQQLQLAPARRDWRQFEQVLARASDAQAEPDLVIRLTARYRELQGDTEGALRLLADGYQKHAASRPWFAAYVSALGRLGKIEQMRSVIEEFSRRSEDATLTNMARAATASYQRQPRGVELELVHALRTASAEERPDILRKLALARVAIGQMGDAREALLAWLDSEPHSIAPLLFLAQLAIAERDWPAAEEWEKQLRGAEGSAGTQWRYCRAKLLLAKATDADKHALKDAAKLLVDLERRRPDWSKTHELSGDLASRQQQWDLAVRSDLKAFFLGERGPEFLARLLAQCYRQDRAQEAADVLNVIVSDNSKADAEALMAAVEFEFQKNRQWDDALRLADFRVKWRPDDASYQLAQAKLLFLAGFDADAESSLARTLRQHASDETTWEAALGLLAETGHSPRLKVLMQQLRDEPALSNQKRAMLLAVGSFWLGNPSDMDRMCQVALRETPDDLELNRRLARMYRASQQLAPAEERLRHVVELAPDSLNDRRQLVYYLIEQGGAKRWREAADMLAALTPAGQLPAPSELRLAALLETRSNGPGGVRVAIDWLEKLQAIPLAATAIDRFRLADLYESAGRIDDAQRVYASLRDSRAATPAMLADYADFLLRNHRDATAVIEQLESVAADRVSTVRLRARWLQQHSRDIEVEPLFARFLETQNHVPDRAAEATDRLLALAEECANLGLDQAAQRWYRDAAAQQPEAYRPLAVYLAQHGRANEGVNLAMQAFRRQPSAATAAALLEIHAQCDAAPSLVTDSEALLQGELSKTENEDRLLPLLAEVRARHGDLAQAVEIYRRLLGRRPNDVRLLNNLAHHLAEIPGEQDEALALINRAIDEAGRQAKLLDTLAHVYLARGEADLAVAVMEEVASGSRGEPMHLVRLAEACHQSGDDAGALQSLQRALDHGLQVGRLPLKQRPLVQELLAKKPM